MNDRPIGSNNEIESYFHCKLCLQEKPPGVSPEQYARLSIGFSPIGLQVWCVRHQCNVVHIDFEEQTHPANLDRSA
jgi:hypothetical protein